MKTSKRFTLYHAIVVGAYLVFGCNLAISYYHAWELFSSIGDFPGFLSHVAVVAFDTVFALATLVISISIMKNIKTGVRIWTAFLFGFAVTSWSNVRASMKDEWLFFVTGQWQKISATGWESFAAGAITPAALVAIEMMLAWIVANRHLFINVIDTAIKTASNQPVSLMDAIKSAIVNKIASATINNQNVTASENVNGTASKQTVNEKTINERGVSLTDSESVGELSNDNASDQSVSMTDQQTKNKSSSLTKNETVNEKTASDDESVNLMENETASEQIASGSVNDNQLTKPSNVVELAKHTSKRTKGRRKKVTPEEIARVKKIALEHKQQNGDFPGRPTLVEKAGCSHHVAKLVLAELKQSS